MNKVIQLGGSAAFIPTFENAAYGIEWTKDNNDIIIGYQANANNHITEFDLQRGPYFVPNLVGTNKKFDYNYIRGNNGQDTDKSVRVLLIGGDAVPGSEAGSGYFASSWVRSDFGANVGFFTTVKLD